MILNKIKINDTATVTPGVVYDISKATGQSYETLFDALSGNNVPLEIREGGMSVRFVHTGDNKYVQFRLMSDSFSTTEADWQGVDDEPTAGSDNLVKSGGIASKIQSLNILVNGISTNLYNGWFHPSGSFISDTGKGFVINVKNNDVITITPQTSKQSLVAFLQSDVYANGVTKFCTGEFSSLITVVDTITKTIPSDCTCICFSQSPSEDSVYQLPQSILLNGVDITKTVIEHINNLNNSLKNTARFTVSNNEKVNTLIKELYFDVDNSVYDFSKYNIFSIYNKVNSNYTFRFSGAEVSDLLIQFSGTTNTVGYGSATILGTGGNNHIFGIFDFSELQIGQQYTFTDCTISSKCQNLEFWPAIQEAMTISESLAPILLYTNKSVPIWNTSDKTLTFFEKTFVLMKNGSRFELPTTPISITNNIDPWKLYLDTISNSLVFSTITNNVYKNPKYILIGWGRSSQDLVYLSCGIKKSDEKFQNYLCPITIYSNSSSPNYDSVNNKLIFYFGTKFIDTGTKLYTYQITDDVVEVSLTNATNMWKLYIDKENTINDHQIVWYAVPYSTLVDAERYLLVATGRSSEKAITISCLYRIDGKYPWEVINNPIDYRKLGYDNNDMIYTYWLYPQISRGNWIRDALYFGYASSQKESGIAQYDIKQKEFKKMAMLLSAGADDHNAMATFVLDDGRILACGSIHGAENFLHIYITDYKQNIEIISTDIKVPIYQVSYAQIFKVGSRYCIFCRSGAGVDSDWKIIYSDDLETWTVKNVVNAPDKKYYLCVREVTDDSNVLRIVMYENPSTVSADTNIRMGFINPSTGNIYNADGTTLLGTWEDGVEQNLFTILINKPEDRRLRLYDVAITEKNSPVIAYTDVYSYTQAIYLIYKNGSIYNLCTSDYDTVSYSFGGMSFVGSENKVVASYHRTEQNDSDIIELFEYDESENDYASLRVLNTVAKQGNKDIRELRPLCDKQGEFVMTFKGYYEYDQFFNWQTDIQIYNVNQ